MSIHGYAVRKDDYYTIIINSNLCPEARMRVYEHELEHIEGDDFSSSLPADLIEALAR